MTVVPPLRLVILGDGTHVNVRRWNHGLQRTGAKTKLLSLRHRKAPSESPTRWLPTFRALGRLNYITAVPFVRHFLLRWQPDVVLAYYATGYGTLGRLCGFHPLVQITSGSDVILAPQNRLMRNIVRRNLMTADLVTAWAPHMAEAARSLGAKIVFELPAGIVLDAFCDQRIPQPELDDQPRMIITRSLKAYYRIDLLIETVRTLKEKHLPFSLTIAGDGPEYGTLSDLVEKYSLGDQVKFVGFVPNQNLPALLAQHNMYISLVPSDGVSASLLEAMAVGLLPFVPNHPANTSWITHAENGFILDDVTPDAIATVIECADHATRYRAWQHNPAIVSERADLYRNAEVYVEQFRQLTGNC